MSSVLQREYAVRRASAALALYSDLHDADLSGLSLDESRTLTMRFNAGIDGTETISTVVVVSRGVQEFRVLPPPNAASGFEGYLYPMNTSVENIDLGIQSGLVKVVIHGTYGWRVHIASDDISIETEAVQPDP